MSAVNCYPGMHIPTNSESSRHSHGREFSVRNRFQTMDCFVLAGGKENRERDFQSDGELTRLERGYRRYAAVFERVTLVLKKEQASGHYLNYPHVCDETSDHGALHGIEAALRGADSDAIFIGSSEITDFPLELLVELVKNYQGEAFLGYQDSRQGTAQPLFGIYNKKLAARLNESGTSDMSELTHLLAREGRLLPLPDSTMTEQINLR